MDYGKATRLARAARNLSQKDLATKANIEPPYLSMIENGRRKPSREVIERLAVAADIPMHLFMLLASEEEDLRGVKEAHVQALGQEFLKLIIAARGKTSDD